MVFNKSFCHLCLWFQMNGIVTFLIFSVSSRLAFKFVFNSIPESSGNDFPIQRTWIVLAFYLFCKIFSHIFPLF